MFFSKLIFKINNFSKPYTTVIFRHFCVSAQPSLKPKNAPFRFVDRRGKILPPLTETQRRELRQILTNIRSGKTYENLYYLSRAPYLIQCSAEDNFQRDFVDVADEWFRQFKINFRKEKNDDLAVENYGITSLLFHLGKLNLRFDGRVAKKLGREPVEFLCNAMLEIGFRNFPHYADVGSAMNGIRDLVLDPRSDRILFENIPNSQWLEGLNEYLAQKKPTDETWQFTIREEAIMVLVLLRHLQIKNPPENLLKTLSYLSQQGLESVATEAQQNDQFFLHNDSMQLQTLASFADAWLWLNKNPNIFIRRLWKTYFTVFGLMLRFHLSEKGKDARDKPSAALQYWNYLPEIAARFEQFKHFRSIFHEFREVLIPSLPQNDHTLKISEAHLANIIYDIGDVAKKCWPQDPVQKAVITDLLGLWPDLEKAVLCIRDQEFSYKSQARTLTGFRNLKWAKFGIYDKRRVVVSGPDEIEDISRPSSSYFDYLTEWCIQKQHSFKTEKNESIRRRAADYTATLLFLIRQLRHTPAPMKPINELIRLFAITIPHLDDVYLARSLAFFWTTCTLMRLDPLVVLVPNDGDSAEKENWWIKFFSGIRKLVDSDQLASKYKSSPNLSDEYRQFLAALPHVISHYHRFDDFCSFSEKYQKRVEEFFSKLQSKKSFDLGKYLSNMNKAYIANGLPPVIKQDLIVELFKNGCGFSA